MRKRRGYALFLAHGLVPLIEAKLGRKLASAQRSARLAQPGACIDGAGCLASNRRRVDGSTEAKTSIPCPAITSVVVGIASFGTVRGPELL